MREEEILEIIEKLQCEYKEQQNDKKYNDYTVFKAKEYSKGLQGLLDLYNKEKEKNKELEEYANWHIEHLTEDIKDYIDDDRKGNASIIGEFKEEREHWKDIIRIINNEKTYIDYKNY